MPNPYFNNQRTFIPNTLVKSDEVNSQFNDVENGFDLIDELVQEVQTDVQQIVAQTTTNTTQITQIINGEIPVGGGAGAGNLPDPGGVGGDPLGASQLPVGGYAYLHATAPVPSNHVTMSEPIALKGADYPELAQVIPPKDDFISNIETSTLSIPLGQLQYNAPVSNGQTLCVGTVAANDPTRRISVVVFTRDNGVWRFATILDTGVNEEGFPSTQPIGSQWRFNGVYLENGYILATFNGYKYRNQVANGTNSKIVVFQGAGDNWVQRPSIVDPTPLQNYQDGFAVDTQVPSGSVYYPPFFPVKVSQNGLISVIAYGVCEAPGLAGRTYGRAYYFSYNLNEVAIFNVSLLGIPSPPRSIFEVYFRPYKDGFFIMWFSTPNPDNDTNDYYRVYLPNDFPSDSVIVRPYEEEPTGIRILGPGVPSSYKVRLVDIGIVLNRDFSNVVTDGDYIFLGNTNATNPITGSTREGNINVIFNDALVQTITAPSPGSDIFFGYGLDAENGLLSARDDGFDRAYDDLYIYERINGQYILKAQYIKRSSNNNDSGFLLIAEDSMIEFDEDANGTFHFYERILDAIGVSPLPTLLEKKTILRVR